MFFNRSKFLTNNFDVYLHCNNKDINEKDIKDRAKFETNVRITVSGKNAGYTWGIPESHADCFEISSKYDRVVYLQADCYIVDDTKLKKDFEYSFDALICPMFHHNRICCAGDFFVVRPTKNIFSNWMSCINKYQVNEHYVFDTLVENYQDLKIYQRIEPSESMICYRKIDKYGLWHEHNNYNVAKYLGLI
jgi:hypothetical protein